jgi:hypothetical protein
MTINDLRCDGCGRYMPSPAGTVRFSYHPGVPELRDDSGLACSACWSSLTANHDRSAPPGQCSACTAPAPRSQSLHVRPYDDPRSWRLCTIHTVEFLNSLRTVTPKLDPATFRFPGQ